VASEPVTVDFSAGMRQDLHRSELPAGALYRAQNVRRRAGAALGPRSDMASAGLATRSGAFALSGATHAIGERAGNQVVAAGLHVWERASSADPWNEMGRVSRFQPLRADLVGPIDSLSALGQAGPLAHQWVAAIGKLVAVAYATATAAVFEVRTESGQLVYRYVKDAHSPDSSQVFPRVLAMPGASTAGKFVFLWYSFGFSIEAASYDIATDTLGPVSAIGGPLFNTPDGYDARELSDTVYLLAYKKDATTFSVKRLDADQNVFAILNPPVAAGTMRPNGVSISGTTGEGVWLLYATVGGVRGVTMDSSLTAVVKADTLVLAEGPTDVFTRPAVCRIDGNSRFCVQHSVTTPGTPPNFPFDRIQTFGLGLNLGVVPLQTFCGCALSSLPECPDGREARFWVDFLTPRADGQRSALISTSVVSGVNAPRLIELTTDYRAGGSSHKPPIAHGATADWYASNVLLRTDTTLGSTVAPQLVGYTSVDASAAAASRTLIEAAGALNVCGGGIITECWGENGRHGNSFTVRLGIDNGLPTPQAFGTAVSAGGSVGVGVCQYCVVFEYLDAVGRRHRSAPSNIVSATTSGGNQTVTLRFSTVGIGDRPAWQSGSLTAHIYRTQANGSTFYRITSNVTAPSGAWSFGGFGFGSFLDYVDTAADATILDNEVLYTQGSVIANQPAPAHRLAAYGDGRLWVAGTWDPRRVECSRLIVAGEPVQFTRHEAFRAYLPEPVTALAYMDGSCVAFTARGVFLIGGSGPNDQGNPALPAPVRVPSDVGCIEPRSVIEVSQGILFQSDRGIYLFPRGFGTPVLASAGVRDDLAGQTVLGAARVHYDASATLASGPVSMGSRVVVLPLGENALVLDEETLQWVSVDSYGAEYGVSGTWGGRLALAATTLNSSDPTALLLESDTFSGIVPRLETGDISPLGPFGEVRVKAVQTLIELRDDTNLTLSIVYDGQYPVPAPEPHPMSLVLKPGTVGTRERILSKTRSVLCNSIRLILDFRSPRAGGLPSLIIGLGLEVEAGSGPTKVVPTRRSA
jgi:hypothetical protein